MTTTEGSDPTQEPDVPGTADVGTASPGSGSPGNDEATAPGADLAGAEPSADDGEGRLGAAAAKSVPDDASDDGSEGPLPPVEEPGETARSERADAGESATSDAAESAAVDAATGESNFPEAEVDPAEQRLDALAPADSSALDKAAESIDDAKVAAQPVRQAQRDDIES